MPLEYSDNIHCLHFSMPQKIVVSIEYHQQIDLEHDRTVFQLIHRQDFSDVIRHEFYLCHYLTLSPTHRGLIWKVQQED